MKCQSQNNKTQLLKLKHNNKSHNTTNRKTRQQNKNAREIKTQPQKEKQNNKNVEFMTWQIYNLAFNN